MVLIDANTITYLVLEGVLFNESDTIFAQSMQRTPFFTKCWNKCLIIFIMNRVPRHLNGSAFTEIRKVGLTCIKVAIVFLARWYFIS